MFTGTFNQLGSKWEEDLGVRLMRKGSGSARAFLRRQYLKDVS
jgi:hypothetical protein